MIFMTLMSVFGIVDCYLLLSRDRVQMGEDKKTLRNLGLNKGIQSLQVVDLKKTSFTSSEKVFSNHKKISSSYSLPMRQRRETPFDSDQTTHKCRLEDFYDVLTLSPKEELHKCSYSNSCGENCGLVLITLLEYRCQCDDLCWLYGDCCLDYFQVCLGVDIREGHQTFLKTILSRVPNYTHVLQYHTAVQLARSSTCRFRVAKGVFMVDKCAQSTEIIARFQELHAKLNSPGADTSHFAVGMPMSEIRGRCDEFNSFSAANKLIQDVVPVIFQLGSHVFHFFNGFCSLCNGVPVNGMQFYETEVTCTGEAAVTLTDLVHTLSSNLSDLTENRTCLVETTLPHMGRTNCFYKPIRCDGPDTSDEYQTLQDVEVANQSSEISPLSRKHLAELCGYYQVPFSDHLQVNSYKNPHCYLCYHFKETIFNGYSEPNITKCPPACLNGFILPVRGFTLLFNFRSRIHVISTEEDSESGALKALVKPQNFTRFFKSSKPFCRKGFTLFARKCVRLFHRRQHHRQLGDGGFNRSGSLQNIYLNSISFRNNNFTIGLNVRYSYLLTARSDDPNESKMEILSEGERMQDQNGDNIIARERGNMSAEYSLQRMTTIWAISVLRDFVKPLHVASRALSDVINDHIAAELHVRFNESVYVLQNRVRFKCSDRKCVDLPDMTSVLDSTHLGNSSAAKASDLISVYPHDFKHGPLWETRGYDTGIQLVLRFDGLGHLQELLQYITELVPKLVQMGHSENFKLSEIKLSTSHTMKTNRLLEISCKPHRELKLTSIPITVNKLGEYVVDVDDREIPKDVFDVQIMFSINEYTSDATIDRVVIPLCKRKFENLTALACSTSMYLHFTFSDYILFDRFLIVSSIVDNASDITEILQKSMFEGNNESVIQVLQEALPGEEFYVYENISYILTDSGAIVCLTYQTPEGESNGGVSHDRKVIVLKDTSSAEQYLSLAASLLTIVCLILCLVVYGVLSELRQNVPGKIILSLSVSLLAAHLMFLFSQSLENLACEIYSLIHHAAWLASFAWLAFMAAHLAYTLQFSTPSVDDSSIFYKGSTLCWGLPIVLASACFILDKTKMFSMDYGKLGPCWIGDDNAMLFTFGIPVFISLTTSLTSSCIVIRSISQSVQFRRRSSRSVGNERHQLFLCFNLTLLMGMSWVAYVIVLVADIPYLWILHDLAHGCEGLFLLLCFVARRSLLSKLLHRMRSAESF